MRDMWAEVFVVFSEEFRRSIRRRSYQVIVAIVPIALLIGVAIVPLVRSATTGRSSQPAPVGYFDESGALSPVNIQGFQQLNSQAAGIQALTEGRIHDFFVIPPDYLSTGKVEWYTSSSGVIPDQNLQTRFENVLRVALVSGKLQPDIAQRILVGSSFARMHVSPSGEVTPGGEDFQKFILPFIFTILLMVSIFMGSGTLLQTVSEEKENRVVEVLLTSVSPMSLMTGKVLALGATSLIQIVVWAGSLVLIGPRIVSQIPNLSQIAIDPLVLLWTLLFFVTGYLLFSAILAGVGSATTTNREAGPITAIFTIPAAVPFYLSAVILGNPTGLAARVMSFIPLTAPTTMMMRVGAPDVSVLETTASLVVTAASAALALFMAARVFRAGLLLYGQRMSLGAVWRALRSAG